MSLRAPIAYCLPEDTARVARRLERVLGAGHVDPAQHLEARVVRALARGVHRHVAAGGRFGHGLGVAQVASKPDRKSVV